MFEYFYSNDFLHDWVKQHPSNIATLHVKPIIGHGIMFSKNNHGRFLNLRRLFDQCLHHLELVLKQCTEKNLTLV